MRWRYGTHAVALALLTTLLAGCIGGDPADQEPEPVMEEGPDLAWTYACTAHMDATTDPCAGFLGDPTRRYGEPNVAVHPSDDDTVAIAAVVTAVHPADGPQAPDVTNLELFVTDDGGDSWRTVLFPLDQVMAHHPRSGQAIGQSMDPAIAFDATGRLHVTALVVPILGNNVPDVYHIATPDLGTTWTTPTFITSDGRSDRNWISVAPDGTVFVAYALGPEGAQVAWSRDGGASWSRLDTPLDCFWFATAPVSVGGQNLTACTRADDSGAYAHIYALHPDAGTAQLLTTFTGPVGRPYLMPRGDDLAFVVDTASQTILYRSMQGPDVWDGGIDVRTLLDGATDHTWMRDRWTTSDPAGKLHLLFESGTHVCGLAVNCDDLQGEILHVVFDPRTEEIFEQRVSPAPPVRATGTLPVRGGAADHYHGIAFGATTGYLVWTWEDRIGYSKLNGTAST